MQTSLIVTYLLCFALAPLSVGCASENQAHASPTTAAVAPPIGHYCNMGVFTPAEHARLAEQLVPKVAAAISDRRELGNGYAFKFSGQLKEAGEWVDLVRRCCSTLDYQLTFAPQGGRAELRITGAGAGAKDFIREEFRSILGKGG